MKLQVPRNPPLDVPQFSRSWTLWPKKLKCWNELLNLCLCSLLFFWSIQITNIVMIFLWSTKGYKGCEISCESTEHNQVVARERHRAPQGQIWQIWCYIILKASHPWKFQPAPLTIKIKTLSYTKIPVPWQGWGYEWDHKDAVRNLSLNWS